MNEQGKVETKAGEFTPPRHWLGVEELQESYWNDPKVQERRGQEFHDKPIETIELIERLDTKGIARRDFLTIMGASLALATASCARRPVHKIIPYVVRPEEIIPGVANTYASTFNEGGVSCGLLVKTREGRPIKLEGNPDHPLNRGALSARAQASLLDLYDPDRMKAPMGRFGEATWAEADQAIMQKLKAAAATGGRVRVLSGAIMSPSTRRLIKEFLAGFKDGALVEFEPLALEEIAHAQNECYGSAAVPRYRFSDARVVVSLGADFMSHWVSPVEHMMDWSKTRKLRGAEKDLSKLVVFESQMTVTGANADERFPLRPGDELKVAMALLHELVLNHKAVSVPSEAQMLLASYKPEAVAADIGLEGGAGRIRKVADALWAAKGKSLVVAGGLTAKTQDALALQVAANWLNTVLQNEGATIDGTLAPYSESSSSYVALSHLIGEMKAGQVEVLIIWRSNPVYALPAGLGFNDGLKKVGLVVAISDRHDETGRLAAYNLPDHHYLENWGDAHPRKGLYSLQQPVIAPLYETRAFQDGLIAWIRGAGLNVPGLAAKTAANKDSTWHEYLKANWQEVVSREAGVASGFEAFWEKTLREGVLDLLKDKLQGRGPARAFKTAALAGIPRFTPSRQELTLALYAKPSMFDGRYANNAWLQEMPDPISTVAWDNHLNISPALAEKLDLKRDDVVEVVSGNQKLELPVYVQPGLHPGVATAAVGYGRTAAGKVGDGAGVDVYPLVQSHGSALVFSGQAIKIRKTGKFYVLAETQWHNATEKRPIINDVALADYQQNPGVTSHTDPHLRVEATSMWPKYDYSQGFRWMMAIDLNSCTGCGACVIACQAENNIPVVGRDNVRMSREMHWIRIDRYYSGEPGNPEVVFQPMLCQHCANAPCETVCPVLATVHDNEGLNEQVYNRCVGTRYCQNNCPYKVRRFNFFDHWKDYKGNANLVWNPEVTVRTRGIMEKCTFCIQRIREAKNQFKLHGRAVNEELLKTACQQTCPTDAIVFGNVNDPSSRVAQIRKHPRAYRVLEVLNTDPSIHYLTKVRNRSAKPSEQKGEHHG